MTRTSLLALLALSACTPGEVHDQITVVHDGAVLPVAVHGNPGTGTLVLFESGGPSGPGIAERMVELIDFRDTLEQDALVASYDRRGVGNAHGGYSPEDLTMDVLVEDLAAVQAVLEERYALDRLVLMGHSFGAQSSAHYLAAGHGPVDAWIPVAPGWTNDDRETENRFRFPFLCRVAADQVAEGSTDPIFAEADAWCATVDHIEVDSPEQDQLWEYLGAFDNKLDPWPGYPPGGLVHAVFFSHYNVIDTQMRANIISPPLHADTEDVDYLDLVARIDIPTLGISGEYDGVGPTEILTAALGDMRTDDTEVVEIAEAGHYPMADREAFAEAVRPWLAAD